MKTPILLMAVLLILLLSACDRPLFGPNLPRETQEGANTFGCRVNGEVWLPNNPVFPYISRGASYGYGSIKGTVTMFATSDDQNSGFSFFFDKLVFGPSTFELPTNLYSWGNKNPLVVHRIVSSEYEPINGFIEITALDTMALGFVSGRFEFDMVNRYDSTDTDTIHITDGRFDVRF
ncbi:MAG: hypothetical protein SF053_05025 [Bacteroidia bacterium]|nr:hypothetical protein [Bacteroidia bacterium]